MERHGSWPSLSSWYPHSAAADTVFSARWKSCTEAGDGGGRCGDVEEHGAPQEGLGKGARWEVRGYAVIHAQEEHHNKCHRFFTLWVPIVAASAVFLGMLVFYSLQFGGSKDSVEWRATATLAEQGFPTPSFSICASSPFVNPQPIFSIGLKKNQYTSYGVGSGYVTPMTITPPPDVSGPSLYCVFLDVGAKAPFFTKENQKGSQAAIFIGMQVATTGNLVDGRLFFPKRDNITSCFNVPGGYAGNLSDLADCFVDQDKPNQAISVERGQYFTFSIKPSYFSYLDSSRSGWAFDVMTTAFTLEEDIVPNPSQTWQGELILPSQVYISYIEQYSQSPFQFLVNLLLACTSSLTTFKSVDTVCKYVFKACTKSGKELKEEAEQSRKKEEEEQRKKKKKKKKRRESLGYEMSLIPPSGASTNQDDTSVAASRRAGRAPCLTSSPQEESPGWYPKVEPRTQYVRYSSSPKDNL